MKQFHRSTDKAILGGVAAGIADYFTVDPILVRLVLVILLLIQDFAMPVILVYLIAWIMVPANDPARDKANTDHLGEKIEKIVTETVSEGLDRAEDLAEQVVNQANSLKQRQQPGKFMNFIGSILILIGVLTLLRTLTSTWFNDVNFWPFILIGLGVWALVKHRQDRS